MIEDKIDLVPKTGKVGKGPADVQRDMPILEEQMFTATTSRKLQSGFESGFDRGMENRIEYFKYVLSQYQEQPNLIDKHVNDFIQRLLVKGKEISKIKPATVETKKLEKYNYSYFYYLTKLRSAKRTLKFLPHQVEDLHWALENLESNLDAEKLRNANERVYCPEEQKISIWEKSYCMLLCLSVTASIPFNLSLFDKDPNPNRMVMVEKLIKIGTENFLLTRTDATADAAALMLGKLFSRSDVQKLYFNDFINDTIKATNQLLLKKSFQLAFQVTAYLKVLCIVIKSSKREEFLENQSKFDNFTKLKEFIENTVHEGASKMGQNVRVLCIKLAQRLALLYLPQKAITWRYNRGKRSLDETLKATETLPDKSGNVQTVNFGSTCISNVITNGHVDEGPPDFWVPDIVEDVIDILLQCLRDKEVKIRWSAAKGLGRITSRLPPDYAIDILPAILEQIKVAENSIDEGNRAKCFHGISLSIAELARRGLIMTTELPEVVDFTVNKALIFDERSVTTDHSVSNQAVRDAACYVCWAIARAYTPKDIKPFEDKIANGLLVISTTDREVNCRRCASAAFQEYVGRQGTFPSGIDIVTKVDYFSVANIEKSIVNLAPWVVETSPKNYEIGFLDHLVEYKICHWDVEIRKLAAKAFAKIFNTENLLTFEQQNLYLKNSIKAAKKDGPGHIFDIKTQHGHLLLLSEVLKNCKINESHQDILFEIQKIPQEISKTTRWKGDAGSLTRSSSLIMCAHLIENYPKFISDEDRKIIAQLAIDSIKYLKGGHFLVILYSVGRMRVIDSGQGSDRSETSSKWFLGNFSRGASGFGPKNIDLGPKNV